MFLKAGALSIALLLASRLLGLLRESAQAAAFGTTGMGDVAVLMLALPDWLAGLLASGALAYVLVPAWAGQGAPQVAVSQRKVARGLLAVGGVLAVLIVIFRVPVAGWLAAGVPQALKDAAVQGLVWSAIALPAALLASLWVTRLQHERDFFGMYAANLVVNGTLVAAIAALGLGLAPWSPVTWLGLGLLAAMALRLAWLRLRQQERATRSARFADPAREAGIPPPPDGRDFAVVPAAMLPATPIWLWAALSAGLPLALPFAARSMASHGGEGALATFNYAWKLVELPLVLAVQLVAALAFPAIAAAMPVAGPPTGSTDRPNAASHAAVAEIGGAEPGRAAVRNAFALAWALACACAAGLLVGAPSVAQLLYGWGRMQAPALAQVAHWGQTAAWGLLPQALIAVALTVLAARARMGWAVVGYALALGGLLSAGAAGVSDGAVLMRWINVLLAGVALLALAGMGKTALRWLPWPGMAAPLAALLAIAAAASIAGPGDVIALGHSPDRAVGIATGLALAASSAALVLASAWLASADLRAALRR